MSDSSFQIILSFKPIMDGLNTFVNGYQSRMQTVVAFNQKIQNGEVALRGLIGQVGVLLGGAALTKYARDAAAADQVQQQLIKTLARTGQTGAVEALNAQATALQRVTNFSDEAVTTVQRLLIGTGLSARQTEALTEQVLDFAQETGQSAESAAALIARTLRGQTDELGRFNLRLDTSKGKVDALREALGRFAAGAARGAVADGTARANTARFADATEDLGRALNRVLVPMIRALLPVIEGLASLATKLAAQLAPLAPAIGDLAAVALPVIIALGLLAGAKRVLLALINPLRTAIVLLSGRSLVDLSNALATATFSARGLAAALAGGSTGLLGILKLLGSALAVVSSLLLSFFSGFQLGLLINDLQVSGRAIKDWVAISIVWIGDRLGNIWTGLREAWALTRIAGEILWDALKSATLNGVIAIIDAWNKLPFGQKLKVDLAPLRNEFDSTVTSLAGAGNRLQAELQRIEAERAKQQQANADLIDFIKSPTAAFSRGSAASPGPAAPDASGGGGKDLNAERFGLDQAESFRLQTQLLQAQIAGNQAEVDRLTDLIEEKKLKQELLQLEAEADPLVKARLAAQFALRAKDRQGTAAELTFQRALGALEIRRADIEADRLTSEQTKQAQVNALLAEQNRLINAKLTLDESQLRTGVTDQEKTRLLQEIDALRKQLTENRRTEESTRALPVGQGVVQGARAFQTSLGTAADGAAAAVQGTLNSALSETGGLLFNLVSGAQTFREAWSSAFLNIGQAFLRLTTDMIAKTLFRATVDRGATAASVALHAGGEAAKTAATTGGIGARLALKAKEILADVYHGAVAAFKALAGIPIIGPVLGAAALAGALALGLGLVAKIGRARGGIIRGPGGATDDQIPALLSNGEAVTRASVVSQFGEGFFEQLNNGVLDLGALPGNVARQLSGAPSAVPSPTLGVAPADAGAAPRVYLLMDRAAFARAMQEDSSAWFQDMSQTFQRRQQV